MSPAKGSPRGKGRPRSIRPATLHGKRPQGFTPLRPFSFRSIFVSWGVPVRSKTPSTEALRLITPEPQALRRVTAGRPGARFLRQEGFDYRTPLNYRIQAGSRSTASARQLTGCSSSGSASSASNSSSISLSRNLRFSSTSFRTSRASWLNSSPGSCSPISTPVSSPDTGGTTRHTVCWSWPKKNSAACRYASISASGPCRRTPSRPAELHPRGTRRCSRRR